MDFKKLPINKIKGWDKNPRKLLKRDFERLKGQIKELGVYKPMLVCPDNDTGTYIVLGGNMRLQAYKDLGVKEVDVVIVNAPTDSDKLKYNLSDNDRVGYYDEQELAEFIITNELQELIDLKTYAIDAAEPKRKLAHRDRQVLPDQQVVSCHKPPTRFRRSPGNVSHPQVQAPTRRAGYETRPALCTLAPP